MSSLEQTRQQIERLQSERQQLEGSAAARLGQAERFLSF